MTALRTGVTQRQGGGPGRRPVDVRADAVHNEYLGHARALDRRHHATAADARGPVEAALRRYGAVVGLVTATTLQRYKDLEGLLRAACESFRAYPVKSSSSFKTMV